MGGRGASGGGGGGGGAAKAAQGLFDRLKAGETVKVSTDKGVKFEIQTKSFAGLTGYKGTQNGKYVPGTPRGYTIMSKSEALNWLSGLRPVK